MALAHVPQAGRFGSQRELLYAIKNDGTLCFWDSDRNLGIVPGIHHAVQLVSNQYACLALTSDGSVYVSPNAYGLFGNHSDGFQRVELTALGSDGEPREMQGVTMMACSESLFVFLTAREMFFHGRQKLYSKERMQVVEYNMQGLVVDFANPAKMAAIGETSILILMSDGRLERLSTDDFSDYETFVCPERGDRFDFVACCRETVLTVTRQGRLYAFGQNDKGHLGFGGEMQMVCDAQGRALRNRFTGEATERVPRLVPLGGKRVCMAAAGRFQSVVVTDDGELWACGFNNEGQLGLGRIDNTRFARVFNDMPLTSVVVTMHQTIGLALDGRVVVIRDPQPRQRSFFAAGDTSRRSTVLNPAAAWEVGHFLPVPPALFHAFAAEGRHPLPMDLMSGIYMGTQVPSETGARIPSSSPLRRLHGHWPAGAGPV